MKRLIFLILLFITVTVYASQQHTVGVISRLNSGGGEGSTISYEAMSSNAVTGESVTFTKPTGTVDGNYLVAWVADDTDSNLTLPDGSWTQLYSVTASSHRLTVAYKEASSEGTDYTFTPATAGSRQLNGGIVRLSKSGGTWDIQDSSQNGLTNVTSITSGSVTCTDNSILLLFLGGDSINTLNTVNPASADIVDNMTNIETHEESSSTSYAYYEARNAGAVTRTADYNGGVEDYTAIAVCLDLVP